MFNISKIQIYFAQNVEYLVVVTKDISNGLLCFDFKILRTI